MGRTVEVGRIDDVAEREAARSEPGSTVVRVVVDGTRVGDIELADTVRSTSSQAIAALRARGLAVVMVTGDAQEAADAVAARVGIEAVYGDARPDEKAAHVERLQADGRTVAHVGAIASTIGTKTARNAVREALDGRAAALGIAHEPHDRLERPCRRRRVSRAS